MKRLPLRPAHTCALLLCLGGCSLLTRHAPPFPPDDASTGQAVVERATWSAPKRVAWDVPDPRGIALPRSEKIAWSETAAPKISVDGYIPFETPPAEESFTIDPVPLAECDLRTLPVLTVTFSTSLLGVPMRTRARPPSIEASATRGILRFGRDQGFSISRTTQLLLDKNGRLWVAGGEGISIFDGEYVSAFGTAQGLASNSPTALMEDASGRVWIGYARDGIDVIDAERGTLSHAGTRQGLPDQRIFGIDRDSAGHVLLCTESGLSILDPQRGRLQHIGALQLPGVGWNAPGSFLLPSADGTLWVDTRQGIAVLSISTGILSRVRLKSGLPLRSGSCCMRDKSGVAWIANREGLDGFDPATMRVLHLGSAQGLPGLPNCVTRDRNGIIWAGCDGTGFAAIDLRERRSSAVGRSEGMSDNAAPTIVCDRDNRLWIGTGANAITMIPPAGMRLMHFGAQLGLGTARISSVLADTPNTIWITASDGPAMLFDTEAGTRKSFALGVTHAMRSANGEIWLSTRNGISVVDAARMSRRGIGLPHGLGGSDVASCTETRDGSVWIATHDGGITVADRAFLHPRRLRSSEGLCGNGANVVLESRDGKIWIGTDGGLDVYSPADGSVRHAALGGLRANAPIAALAQDQRGRIWIGSAGEGLAILDPSDDRVLRFADAGSLPSMQLCSFLEDNGGMWCATSGGLVEFFPATAAYPSQRYGNTAGFPKLAFARLAATRAADGSAWWGVADIVTRMEAGTDPDTATPRAFITGVDVNERHESFLTVSWLRRLLAHRDAADLHRNAMPSKEGEKRDSGYLQKQGITWDGVEGPFLLPRDLRLPWKQDHLAFSFTGGHLDNNAHVQYRYILEGSDDRWSAMTEQPYAEYRNLRPGRHVFTVRCRSGDGRWSPPASFAFVITPPPWQTWWAYSIYALLLVALTVLGARVQKRRLLRKELAAARSRENALLARIAQAENERQEAELSAARDLEQAQRTLLGAQAQLARSARPAPPGQTSADFAHDGQEAGVPAAKPSPGLDGSGTSRPRATELNTLLEDCTQLAYLRMQADDPDFRCAIHRDLMSDLPLLAIAPQDAARMFTTLLDNAFQAVDRKRRAAIGAATYEPGIGVRSAISAGRIEIAVSDNGAGIASAVRGKIFEPYFTTHSAGEGSGLGLSVARDIVAAHAGIITFRSREGVGTEFIISLPLPDGAPSK